MRWETCYIQGKSEGFFINYASYHTLKSACHNQKAKLRKRKAANIMITKVIMLEKKENSTEMLFHFVKIHYCI
jgi:hypothetical protein